MHIGRAHLTIVNDPPASGAYRGIASVLQRDRWRASDSAMRRSRRCGAPSPCGTIGVRTAEASCGNVAGIGVVDPAFMLDLVHQQLKDGDTTPAREEAYFAGARGSTTTSFATPPNTSTAAPSLAAATPRRPEVTSGTISAPA
jgi:hypothetical protein